MTHHTDTEPLFALLLAFLLLLGVEYYLLIQPGTAIFTEDNRLWQWAASVVLRWGNGLRLGFLFTYSVLTWSLVHTNQPAFGRRSSLGATPHLLTGAVVVVASYQLYTMTWYDARTIYWLYPISLVGILFALPTLIFAISNPTQRLPERSERKKVENGDSIHIRTKKGYINVPNPFRGTLVIGSSGSGKSASIGNAFLHQFVRKGYCGVLYDFKFPTLANVVNTALHEYGEQTDLTYYLVNLQDPHLSHRCNPLAPANIATFPHAEEYARAVVNNLDTNTIKHQEFFSNSAIAWLAALIWFYRSEHPEYCTLPHVINTVLYPDYTHVISMLEANPQSADMIRSIATAIQKKADKQIAGVIASLQIMITRINSPEMVWALTGDDFDMDVNDPAHPKLLCLGSDPSLVEAFSPVISLIITVALKQMNRQGKRKSFVLLDEAPTLYIPKFEIIPATARSNRVASVYMAQDFAQMYDMHGREKADVIVANLSNQFYGKVSSVPTAKAVSEMIGKEEQLITNHSRGSSRGSKGDRNLSHNISTSWQERLLIRPQQVMQLRPGEFIGQTVESHIPYFCAQTQETKSSVSYRLQTFARGKQNLQNITLANFQRIRSQVAATVQRYPNLYEQI